MKYLLVLLSLWSFVMSETIVPYPHPQSRGDELLAKEVVSGAYLASISMTIRNTKTGQERYIYVPDSDVIDKMESGEQVKKVGVEDIDTNTQIYDRDKSLEDAVLPKKVDTGKKLPEIVSKALCPQDVDYVGSIGTEYGSSLHLQMGRYYDGEKDFMVVSMKTEDNTDGGDLNDKYQLKKVVGTTVTTLFEFTGNYPIPANKNGRNFFFLGNDLYEYNESGYTKLISGTDDMDGYYFKNRMILVDGSDFYSLVKNGDDKVCAINIDNKNIICSDIDFTDSNVGLFDSCSNDRYSTRGIYIKNGEIGKAKISENTAHTLTRFDYVVNPVYYADSFYNYNKKNQVFDYPRIQHGIAFYYKGDIRDRYVDVLSNGSVVFYKDFINPTDTGELVSIKDKRDFAIVITEDYFYVGDGTSNPVSIKAFRINKWGMQVPRAEYGELFAKEGLLNTDYIGGY